VISGLTLPCSRRRVASPKVGTVRYRLPALVSCRGRE